MAEQIEIHAYHGWGCDGSFWDALKAELPKEIIFKAADRGYFGGAFEPEFHEDSKQKLIFVHSYGLHWFPIEKLEVADWIIAFNTFAEFLPRDRSKKREVVKVLRSMISNLKKNPTLLLQNFYRNAFYPDTQVMDVPTWMNRSKLLADLKDLKNSSFSLPKGITINACVLSSKKDIIYNYKQSIELVGLLNTDISTVFDGAGHVLPIVNSNECWRYLSRVIPIFEPYANEDHTE